MQVDELLPAIHCQLIYDNPSYFDKIIDNGSVYLGIKVIGKRFTVTCRGSLSPTDWYHDVISFLFFQHPILGRVSKGFINGVDDAFTQVCQSLPPRHPGETYPLSIEIYGHSLGGAHATYLAGLFFNAGFTVKLVAFESPACCHQPLLDLLKDSDVTGYRNGNDIVTDVPVGLEHPRQLIVLNCPPVIGDITPFKYHHMALVVCGLTVYLFLRG